MSPKVKSAGFTLPTPETIWAFDLGKASLGEAVRTGTKFLHVASLLLPEDFASTRPAAKRRRMHRTRLAHKAREAWLRKVLSDAGIEVLKHKEVSWEAKTQKWIAHPADPRLEREFAAPGDNTCYTSCLLRIKLLRGDKLEGWQIYKAFHSAIQRRGYDPSIPWKGRCQRNNDEEKETFVRMQDYERSLSEAVGAKEEFLYPCYYDAWQMKLWNPAEPRKLAIKQGCDARSTRNQIVPRKLVEKELRDLVDAAAKFYPSLKGKADYLLYGKPGQPYASYYPKIREKFHLREGAASDWHGALGQKIPRFDNRIIGKCVLIPRLNVCKIKTDANGDLHPASRLAAEVVFLMKLKNMRLPDGSEERGLTAAEICSIFNNPKRTKLAMTPTQWNKFCESIGCKVLPGHAEVTEPSRSGRASFCRPALAILKRLIMGGLSPREAYKQELDLLNGNKDPLKGLVPGDLGFLLRMGETWEGVHIPNQKVQALVESTALDAEEKINELIRQQNDPVVRHRLTLFADRLRDLEKRHGRPNQIVLEFVREDFMGLRAKLELQKFQRERASERQRAREEAAKLGAHGGGAGLRVELYRTQGGICLYTGESLALTGIEDYAIDHIVPRAQGGSDSVLNYALTTTKTNDLKADRTPFEWLSHTPGWAAYLERVKGRAGALRNKKVKLLTSAEAPELVQKYTALAETAWISKLAQTIVAIQFGWPMGIEDGTRKITIVSGGLTGRIRRRHKLNSILNPTITDEEKAETKNRKDDRHHALDAMVISFIPGWARNPGLRGFFSFPEGVTRDSFAKEIEKVIPRNVCFKKPELEETIYGLRMIEGHKFAVGRELLADLAAAMTKNNKRKLKPLKKIPTSRIVDPVIRREVEAFLESSPELTLDQWDAWCATYRKGGEGPRVVKCLMTKSKRPDAVEEYKDVSKDGSGQWKRAARHKGYFVCEVAAPTRKDPERKRVKVVPVYAHDAFAAARARLEGKVVGYFESGCLVSLDKPWRAGDRHFPGGYYICSTIKQNGQATLLHPQLGKLENLMVSNLLVAGFKRVDI